MLNHNLRLLNVESILQIDFFAEISHTSPLIVYRGQDLCIKKNFDKVIRSKGGFLSFNNLLLTSKSRKVFLNFARCALRRANSLGILLVISIDRAVFTSPYTLLNEHSFVSMRSNQSTRPIGSDRSNSSSRTTNRGGSRNERVATLMSPPHQTRSKRKSQTNLSVTTRSNIKGSVQGLLRTSAWPYSPQATRVFQSQSLLSESFHNLFKNSSILALTGDRSSVVTQPPS